MARRKSRLSWNLLRGLDKATVYYDGACGLCRGAVKWMAKADWFQRVTWTPGQELSSFPNGLTPADLDEAMYLEDSQCRLHGGFFAVRRLALILPPLLPLAPFMWLPGARFLGVRLYAFIARNRGCLLGTVRGGGKPPR